MPAWLGLLAWRLPPVTTCGARKPLPAVAVLRWPLLATAPLQQLLSLPA